MLAHLVLRAALASVATTLLLAGSAGAASTYTTSVGTKTATWSENTTGIGAGIQLSIEPKGPGAADDRLIIGFATTGGGCTPVAGGASCPLGSGTVALDTLVINVSGSTSTYNLYADFDRPELRMTSVVTLGVNSTGTFDGSTTHVGPIAATGFSTITGGDDDDALTGRDAASTITGGPGDDALSGRGGNDILNGGPGDDTISPGEGGVEQADGGEGSQDTLSAAGETGPAAFSLDGVLNDSVIPGQLLTASGFENLVGSDGPDQLIGNGGFNHIYGGAGNDKIDGNGGGHDVLRGQAGDDLILSRDILTLFSDVGCGGGTDTTIVDAADLVASDCESVDRSPAPAGYVAPSFPGGPTSSTGAPAGNTSPAPGSVAAVSLVPPIVTLDTPKSVKRSSVKKGVKVTVSCDQVASVVLELVTTAKSARASRAAVPKDNLTIARSTRKALTGRETVTIKPDAKLARSVGNTLSVRVTATNAAGVTTVLKRPLKLR